MSENKDKNWPKDEFARDEVVQFYWWLIIPAIAILAALLLPAISWFKKSAKPHVVLYCAQDQVYAEPLVKRFERETGIRVRAVYDSEAVKTVGLANRLLAERRHPQCDVFWGNEEMRTRQLAAQDVFRATNGWVAFGSRTRRIVVNTNFVEADRMPPPASLLDLTNTAWRGKVALAFPQFGTTATHFHALRQHWGEAAWLAWCRALVANQSKVVDGNSVVVQLVGRGEVWVGLTDSDDIFAGQREGLPVAELPLDDETLFIPNTAGIIRNAPREAAAEKLVAYFQRPDVVATLVSVNALESADLPRDAGLQPDWPALLHDLDHTVGLLNEVFLR